MALLERSTRASASGKPKTTKFRPDIQGLRALAVIAVIADHFLGWPSGGFIGVDVFFVISGFLITSLLLREQVQTGTISFIGFYFRRAKRIMPAALLVIAATIAAAFALYGSARITSTVWDGVWATLFGANWRFAIIGTDYFQAGGPTSPLQHYWSLSVEEQFYFVWPWLMLLIFWAASRWKSSLAGARSAVGVSIVLLTALSFAWSVWETQNNASWAYFSTFSRAWELGVGAIVAVYSARFSGMRPGIRETLGWIGLAGIVVAVFTTNDAVAFPGPSAAFPVLATALVIAAGIGRERSFLWPLTNPVSRYLGDISYSLYLWHFPVAILLLSLFPRDSLEYYIVGIILMLVLSALSFHLIENPVRKLEWPMKHRPRPPRAAIGDKTKLIGLAALAVLTTCVVVGALMPRDTSDGALASSGQPVVIGESAALPKVKCWGAAALDASADCSRDIGNDVAPASKALAADLGNSYDCFPPKGHALKTCAYGAGETRVAIVGDSHAAALLPGLTDQVVALGWKLDTYVGEGCIWEADACVAMGDIQAKLLAEPYDIVITSAYRGNGDRNKELQAAAFAAQWRPVAAAGSKIVVVEDNPTDAGDAVECVQRINLDVASNDCSIDLSSAFRLADAAVMAASAVENSVVVETRKYFCTSIACPGIIGNVLVYRDDISHISGTFSKTLGPYLAQDIAKATSSISSK
ncbi:acyltransferase family protein [Arthrobacter sp. Soil762]|uniref:acyltransferase family protein n=1 Tax=Arthrobacter sp. Soil762 TaxID=1736401 RepID=UPI0006FB41B1|nr:acyltransferase family protein [Arthrobacter sp. Soil762]KRE74493.1 hypothetical protein ASG77_07260 [Arthrobacter sp. Soil762]